MLRIRYIDRHRMALLKNMATFKFEAFKVKKQNSLMVALPWHLRNLVVIILHLRVNSEGQKLLSQDCPDQNNV